LLNSVHLFFSHGWHKKMTASIVSLDLIKMHAVCGTVASTDCNVLRRAQKHRKHKNTNFVFFCRGTKTCVSQKTQIHKLTKTHKNLFKGSIGTITHRNKIFIDDDLLPRETYHKQRVTQLPTTNNTHVSAIPIISIILFCFAGISCESQKTT
jgi:hypothetical protein